MPLTTIAVNDRLDRFLLHIGQHPENDLAIALDQAQDRRLFLFKRTTTAGSFQASAPPGPTFLDGRRVALVTGDDVDFVGLDRAVQRRLGNFGNQAFAKMRRSISSRMPPRSILPLIGQRLDPLLLLLKQDA